MSPTPLLNLLARMAPETIAQVSPGDSINPSTSNGISSHTTSSSTKSLSKGASIALAIIIIVLLISIVILGFVLNQRSKAKKAANDKYVTPVERLRNVVKGKKGGEEVEIGDYVKEDWEKDEDADVSRPKKIWSPL